MHKIVQEKISGVIKQKQQLDDLLSRIVSGDTLVVTRIDRLGRNTVQMLQLVEGLRKKMFTLSFLTLKLIQEHQRVNSF